MVVGVIPFVMLRARNSPQGSIGVNMSSPQPDQKRIATQM